VSNRKCYSCRESENQIRTKENDIGTQVLTTNLSRLGGAKEIRSCQVFTGCNEYGIHAFSRRPELRGRCTAAAWKKQLAWVDLHKMLGVCGLHHPLAAPATFNSGFLKPPPPQSLRHPQPLHLPFKDEHQLHRFIFNVVFNKSFFTGFCGCIENSFSHERAMDFPSPITCDALPVSTFGLVQ